MAFDNKNSILLIFSCPAVYKTQYSSISSDLAFSVLCRLFLLCPLNLPPEFHRLSPTFVALNTLYWWSPVHNVIRHHVTDPACTYTLPHVSYINVSNCIYAIFNNVMWGREPSAQKSFGCVDFQCTLHSSLLYISSTPSILKLFWKSRCIAVTCFHVRLPPPLHYAPSQTGTKNN